MSRGDVQSSHDRCVTYNASNLIMVIYSTVKREKTQGNTLCGLEICLNSLFGTRESLRLKIRKI